MKQMAHIVCRLKWFSDVKSNLYVYSVYASRIKNVWMTVLYAENDVVHEYSHKRSIRSSEIINQKI